MDKKELQKNILFLNQSSGYLMIDIVNRYQAEGFECVLLTGSLNPRKASLKEDVKVHKIALYKRNSTLKRLLTWTIATIQAYFLILFKYRNHQLFLVSNPPFSAFLPILLRNKYTFLIYDIYPDVLVEFKLLKPKSTIVKTWRWLNKRAFRKAENVFTISDGMAAKLGQYVASEKIKIVPIWTDNSFLKPVLKSENDFLKQQGISDKFVIIYSGNMGKTHPIETIGKLAEIMSHAPEFFFLLIGGGDKFETMRRWIAESGLTNIRILPWQDTSLLPLTLSAGDLAIVTLSSGAADLSIPSKTYNLMSTATPIISIAHPESALAKLIVDNQIGQSFQENELEKIREFILEMKNNQDAYQSMRERCLKTSEQFTSRNASLFIR